MNFNICLSWIPLLPPHWPLFGSKSSKNIRNYNVYCDRLEIIKTTYANANFATKNNYFFNKKYVARKTTKFISFSHHLCARGRPPERHQCCKTAEKFDLASLEVTDETSPAPPGAPSPPQEPQVPPRSPQGHPRSSQCLPKSPQELSETSSRDKHYINKLPINRPSGRLVY